MWSKIYVSCFMKTQIIWQWDRTLNFELSVVIYHFCNFKFRHSISIYWLSYFLFNLLGVAICESHNAYLWAVSKINSKLIVQVAPERVRRWRLGQLQYFEPDSAKYACIFYNFSELKTEFSMNSSEAPKSSHRCLNEI
jgi:hypothetical protein